jgi:hypothetical protein
MFDVSALQRVDVGGGISYRDLVKSESQMTKLDAGSGKGTELLRTRWPKSSLPMSLGAVQGTQWNPTWLELIGNNLSDSVYDISKCCLSLDEVSRASISFKDSMDKSRNRKYSPITV